MDEERILYSDKTLRSETPYLRICEVKVINDHMNIIVCSDMDILELWVCGRLRCRQKNEERFDFSVPLENDAIHNQAVIRVSSKSKPEVFSEVVVGV